MLSPPQFKRGKRVNSQTSPVSRIAVAPKTSKSGAIGRLREARTINAGLAPADQEHQTIGRDWRAHPDNRNH
jgi:hypothetical protein